MLTLLAKRLIKDYRNLQNPDVRSAYGTLCGVAGIVLNLFLFAGKYTAGLLSASVAISADAFNNLTDSLSSLISMIGFRLSRKKPDSDHPYGHGRFEYIAGFVVSILILMMGYELLKDSVGVILYGGETPFAAHFGLSVAILCASLLVKLYMFVYNRGFGKRIESETLQAAALDSLGDMVSTSVVLICSLITRFVSLPSGFPLDAWCGAAVSVFILYTAITSFQATLSPLLGKPPAKELVQAIVQEVLSFDGIYGVHDLIIHDYGPGRRMLSLHVEVPDSDDIRTVHERIDRVEQRLREKFDCTATIHPDPITTNDPEVLRCKEDITSYLALIDPRLSLHDFHMIPEGTRVKVLFDVVVPYDCKTDEETLRTLLKERIQSVSERYNAVIEIDKPFVSE